MFDMDLENLSNIVLSRLQKNKNFNDQSNLIIEDKLYFDDEYRSLSEEEGKLNFNIGLSLFQENGKAAEEYKIKLNEVIQKKNSLREKLVKSINVRYLTTCPYCNGTGINENGYCLCYYKEYRKLISEITGLEIQNYPEITPLDHLKDYYGLMDRFVEKFPETKINNFIFSGYTGTGKTMLSKYTAKKLEDKNNIVVYIPSSKLNNLFFKIHRNEPDSELINDVLLYSNMLIIDDLGTEPIFRNVTVEYLLSTISGRLDNKKHFIITTNLTSEEIKDRYNERLFSRLMDKDHTKFIMFENKDLRIYKDVKK